MAYSGVVLTKTDVSKDIFWAEWNQTMGNTGLLECYCVEAMKEEGMNPQGKRRAAVASRPPDPTSPGLEKEEYEIYNPKTKKTEPMCPEWSSTKAYVMGLKYLAVVGVVVVNAGLKGILKTLVAIETHDSVTKEIKSLTLKLFLAQFVNTALLVLFINGNLESVGSEDNVGADPEDAEKDSTGLSSLAIFAGTYSDFSPDWYLRVGVPIIMTMLINMAAAQAPTITNLITMHLKQFIDRGFSFDFRITGKVSQVDLEDLYMGPEFDIELRYAMLLNMFFVCLLYSAGMPILTLIAAGTFFMTYLFDKISFLRLCVAL